MVNFDIVMISLRYRDVKYNFYKYKKRPKTLKEVPHFFLTLPRFNKPSSSCFENKETP